MEEYQFGEAQRQLHDFLWGEYCDWYIEFAKIRLASTGEAVTPVPVLVHVLETSLRLLHPFMPFVTEELWQHLRKHLNSPAESIMVSRYPEADADAIDPPAETVMETVIEIIHSIRNIRAQYRVASNRWVAAQIYAARLTPTLKAYSDTIQSLARAKPVTFLEKPLETAADDNALTLVLKEAEILIPMESVVDREAENKRLNKEIEQAQAEVNRLEARLTDQAFLTRAPAAVVEKERQKLYTLNNKLNRLKEQILM